MSDTETILQALKEHREETRQDMHELRQAVVKIADAAADMGKTMARSEQRHGHHEEVGKRMGRQIDDHETRIRIIESSTLTGRGSVTGGWKVITVIGAVIIGATTLFAALARFIK